MDDLFEKIIKREIQADIVYEDDACIAMRDINPQAPTHVLLVPKQKIAKLSDATPEHQNLLGDLMVKVGVVADKLGLDNNFRVVINNGPQACQSIYHLHLHILSGRQMHWPPG